MTVFSRQNKSLQYMQGKTSNKMSETHIYRYVCCETNFFFFFFDVFINHFPKIHSSDLCKIAINLLYFWDVYDVNQWEKK